nr:hypothetical protein [Saprospiraceae bacterium]
SSDDLSKTSHYWEAWNSYIFSKLEGNADLDNDGIYESSFTYHTGRDDMYRTLNFTKDLSIVSDSDTKVGFNLDVKKLLVNANNEALDIVLHPDSHTPSQIGTATIIMDNYQNAISLQ